MAEINIYCDESNHLESDKKPMVLGALYCPKDKARNVNRRIREIKEANGLSQNFEIKWTKVTERNIKFYLDILNYFYDTDQLGIRILVANKANLSHTKYKQTHDTWYYKMYYQLLTKIIKSEFLTDQYHKNS